MKAAPAVGVEVAGVTENCVAEAGLTVIELDVPVSEAASVTVMV